MKLPNGPTVSAAEATRLINDYYARNAAVWDLYDNLDPGPRDKFGPHDVLSLNALNAFGPRTPMGGMTGFWSNDAARRDASKLLKGVTRLPVEKLDKAKLATATARLAAVADKINEQCQASGFGDVATAKLLHRMRPGLAAIFDTSVAHHYPQQGWQEFYGTVAADVFDRREKLRAAVKKSKRPSISLMRAWDIVLWMTAPS